MDVTETTTWKPCVPLRDLTHFNFSIWGRWKMLLWATIPVLQACRAGFESQPPTQKAERDWCLYNPNTVGQRQGDPERSLASNPSPNGRVNVLPQIEAMFIFNISWHSIMASRVSNVSINSYYVGNCVDWLYGNKAQAIVMWDGGSSIEKMEKERKAFRVFSKSVDDVEKPIPLWAGPPWCSELYKKAIWATPWSKSVSRTHQSLCISSRL